MHLSIYSPHGFNGAIVGDLTQKFRPTIGNLTNSVTPLWGIWKKNRIAKKYFSVSNPHRRPGVCMGLTWGFEMLKSAPPWGIWYSTVSNTRHCPIITQGMGRGQYIDRCITIRLWAWIFLHCLISLQPKRCLLVHATLCTVHSLWTYQCPLIYSSPTLVKSS